VFHGAHQRVAAQVGANQLTIRIEQE